MSTDNQTNLQHAVPKGDQGLLEHDLRRQITQIQIKALETIEQALPHQNGDGSANESQFLIARRRVLRATNDALRELPLILMDYYVKQVLQRTVVTKIVAQLDENDLPPGVKIR